MIVDGDDIQGDGVNVAARLESLSEAGGICISSAVHEQVRDRLDLTFEHCGNQQVKNIDRPVRIWRWSATSAPTAASSSETEQSTSIPDKPSIAVLPFTNLSDDPEQEYFSDGVAEDIITALSRFHQFFVIARNSSFTYKARAVDIKQIAHELSVQYIIEGSVRRAGNRMRITAQLIDAASDRHIWAERYDRQLDDIFAVQDDITQCIAMAVGPELDSTEMTRAKRKNIPELGVWELLARAYWHGARNTEKDNAEAEDILTRAKEIDPDNARIHAAFSRYYITDGLFGWQRPQPQSRALALGTAQRAVELDKHDELAHAQLGFTLFMSKRHEEGIQRFRNAINLNPNYSFALGGLGVALVYTHKHDEALELLHKAIRLSPKDPALPYYTAAIGYHHFIEKRYDDARMWAEKALHESPNHPTGYRLLATAHGMMGDLAEARAAYEQLDRLTPGVTISACIQAVRSPSMITSNVSPRASARPECRKNDRLGSGPDLVTWGPERPLRGVKRTGTAADVSGLLERLT